MTRITLLLALLLSLLLTSLASSDQPRRHWRCVELTLLGEPTSPINFELLEDERSWEFLAGGFSMRYELLPGSREPGRLTLVDPEGLHWTAAYERRATAWPYALPVVPGRGLLSVFVPLPGMVVTLSQPHPPGQMPDDRPSMIFRVIALDLPETR